MNPICEKLRARGIAVSENASMRERTTLRVGGCADVLAEPSCAEELAAALALAGECGASVLVMGNGSNLLVRDGGIRGVVLRLGEKMSRITREGNCLRAGAGALLGAVAQAAQREGLSGLEPLSGIPGSCGGAVCMNAGAYGGEVRDVLEEATLLTGDGRLETVPAQALNLSYRHSRLMETDEIVTEAVFRLTPGDGARIAEAMRQLAAKRREKQPVNLPSAGSFFKRPQGGYAAALIEAAGLKGASVGGAQVSPLHAGFLVNTGGASARDFLELSALVTERVFQMSGIRLDAEVRIVGCDLSC